MERRAERFGTNSPHSIAAEWICVPERGRHDAKTLAEGLADVPHRPPPLLVGAGGVGSVAALHWRKLETPSAADADLVLDKRTRCMKGSLSDRCGHDVSAAACFRQQEATPGEALIHLDRHQLRRRDLPERGQPGQHDTAAERVVIQDRIHTPATHEKGLT